MVRNLGMLLDEWCSGHRDGTRVPVLCNSLEGAESVRFRFGLVAVDLDVGPSGPRGGPLLRPLRRLFSVRFAKDVRGEV